MAEFIDVPATSLSSSPGNPERPACTNVEITAGKAFAVISYALNFIHIPFFVVPLIMRSDRFSLYHSKQCLILWLAALAASTVLGLAIIATFGFGACVAVPIGVVLWVAGIVLNILGLISAVNGRCTPMPAIGGYAERWFAGIKAQPQPGNTL